MELINPPLLRTPREVRDMIYAYLHCEVETIAPFEELESLVMTPYGLGMRQSRWISSDISDIDRVYLVSESEIEKDTPEYKSWITIGLKVHNMPLPHVLLVCRQVHDEYLSSGCFKARSVEVTFPMRSTIDTAYNVHEAVITVSKILENTQTAEFILYPGESRGQEQWDYLKRFLRQFGSWAPALKTLYINMYREVMFDPSPFIRTDKIQTPPSSFLNLPLTHRGEGFINRYYEIVDIEIWLEMYGQLPRAVTRNPDYYLGKVYLDSYLFTSKKRPEQIWRGSEVNYVRDDDDDTMLNLIGNEDLRAININNADCYGWKEATGGALEKWQQEDQRSDN